jgi:signal transduction histidine kinase
MITHTRSAEGSTLGVHVDITDMVRLQQELTTATRRAEEALAVRTRFLANMSHELRTPLNAVIGFSELMMMETQGPLDARYLDFARIIKQSGEFLLSLIVDILDIARIEAGKMSVGQEPVALAGIVREVAAMLSLQAERKGLRLTLALPPGDTVVPGDPRRLKQVVQNLMSNAVKFTETGEVSVSLEREGAAVRLCVADTGRGMSAEDIAFAMEPFQQRRGMDSREVMEGTGLGLPLVKALVDLHGGRFELVSEPGRGTDATVWLPAVAAGGAVV